MTNEEAIKVLKDLRIFDDDCEEDCKAIDLGISALEKQIKLNEIGFTEEVIENYKIFEDECITRGFTFKSLLDARDKQINGGWIKCSERLPKNQTERWWCTTEYLTCSKDGTIEVLCYCDGWNCYFLNADMDVWRGNEIKDVIAWMPLPQPL